MLLKDYINPERVKEFKVAESGAIYVQDLLLDSGIYVEMGDSRINALLNLFDQAVFNSLN
tara:strand:- start:547 stop:726 length:180 start_codon:yes stop_codon:yes gene_type:complete